VKSAMKTMAFEIVGATLVVVHCADPPNKTEWDAYIAAAAALFERVGTDRARNMAFSLGGGPSFSQRQQINAVLKGRAALAAVVTPNAFVRSIVAAISVFNPKIKVFRPEAVGEAFRYLGISESEAKVVRRTVAKLEAELGLGGKLAV
jgi:hypothetical protein